ncbi:MAG: hypothetical protein J0L92_01795 [Deltaproteobacteria bacterium]|nr:hypothetical protein [Deltaproteobacteria bacterium]
MIHRTASLRWLTCLFLGGCTLVVPSSRRVGEEHDAGSALDAVAADASAADASDDAPRDASLGLDAHTVEDDAFAGDDAFVGDDAFAAHDVSLETDAIGATDAFAGGDGGLDAFASTDAFEASDAFVADAFTVADAPAPSDAFAPLDAFVPNDAFTCLAVDTTCDGIDADCDGVPDQAEMSVNTACEWGRCVVDGSITTCDMPALVAAGGYHSCVTLAVSGDLWCWGLDSSEQLPGISVATPANPVAPRRSSISGVRDLCAYDAGTCVATATHVVCEGTGAPSAAGMPWTRAVDASAVACGTNHVCVVTSAGGVQCAGRNGNGSTVTGQIGRSLADGVGPFLELSSVMLPVGRRAVEVAVATNFTCARLDDDSVWCWGANDVGQLGRGGVSASVDPTPAQVSTPGGVAFRGLATSQFAACANTGGSSPDVYCWGSQADGVTIGQPVAATGIFTPTPDATRHPFSSLAASPHGMCARNPTGQITCWGRQTAGEFGPMVRSMAATVSSSPTLAYPRAGPATLASLELALGYTNASPGLGGHACAITGGGVVLCWGSDVGGQCGLLPPIARVEDARGVLP